jgi:hypothetical protein
MFLKLICNEYEPFQVPCLGSPTLSGLLVYSIVHDHCYEAPSN